MVLCTSIIAQHHVFVGAHQRSRPFCDRRPREKSVRRHPGTNAETQSPSRCLSSRQQHASRRLGLYGQPPASVLEIGSSKFYAIRFLTPTTGRRREHRDGPNARLYGRRIWRSQLLHKMGMWLKARVEPHDVALQYPRVSFSCQEPNSDLIHCQKRCHRLFCACIAS